jgi:ribosomal protein L13
VKTYSAKSSDVERKWFVIDAASAPLGRMATQVATLLRGKHKPMYTPPCFAASTSPCTRRTSTRVTTSS